MLYATLLTIVYYMSPLFSTYSGELSVALAAREGEVASVHSLTDPICQAITLGMCYSGFAKQHYSMK